jgi:amidase
MTDPTFLSTTQLASAIRAGQVSAAEALDAHLAQIEKHNPALNAVVTLDPTGWQAMGRVTAAGDREGAHCGDRRLPAATGLLITI